jgi:uncharacterized protein (TIGR02646 family)
MIRLDRIQLEDRLAGRLEARSASLKISNADSKAARKAWNTAPKEKQGIRAHLVKMAPGVERCMYCGDSRGTDIDHFEPIKEYPAGTFEWLNHLLACSFCNSNSKRDQFPRDTDGSPLLVDPTRDDPMIHLRLIITTGRYHARTSRGAESIRVFDLNRDDLVRGRQGAFLMAEAALCRAHGLLRHGRREEAAERLFALAGQPHLSVLREMLRLAGMPGGAEILGTEVVAALTDPEVLAVLGGAAPVPPEHVRGPSTTLLAGQRFFDQHGVCGRRTAGMFGP